MVWVCAQLLRCEDDTAVHFDEVNPVPRQGSVFQWVKGCEAGGLELGVSFRNGEFNDTGGVGEQVAITVFPVDLEQIAPMGRLIKILVDPVAEVNLGAEWRQISQEYVWQRLPFRDTGLFGGEVDADSTEHEQRDGTENDQVAVEATRGANSLGPGRSRCFDGADGGIRRNLDRGSGNRNKTGAAGALEMRVALQGGEGVRVDFNLGLAMGAGGDQGVGGSVGWRISG